MDGLEAIAQIRQDTRLREAFVQHPPPEPECCVGMMQDLYFSFWFGQRSRKYDLLKSYP